MRTLHAGACIRPLGIPIRLAAPFFFVLANFALLSYLRQQEFRYMGVMDVFLMLQIAIALGHVASERGKQARLTSR